MMEQILNEFRSKQEAVTITNESVHYESRAVGLSIPLELILEIDCDKKSHQLVILYDESQVKDTDDATLILHSFDRYDLDSMMDSFSRLMIPRGFQEDHVVKNDVSSFFGPLIALIAFAVYAYFNWEMMIMFLFIGCGVLWSLFFLLKKKQPAEIHRVLTFGDESDTE